MKILYLVLSINAFISVQSKIYPAYARQYTALQNQGLDENKRYVFIPASTNQLSSNVYEGRQYPPWRRTIPLVPQSDSVGGQATNQVSLLSLIALALNLGNSLFAVPVAQPQRDPASSVAAGVTSGILNYISTQNGGQASNLNDPVAPNRQGINVPDNLNTVNADTAAVSRVRQYRITPFPFRKGDWEWETEVIKSNKIPRRVRLQHMTNLNIFLNRGPHSQQVFNRMKNSQNMQRDLKHLDISKHWPQRVIVLVPNHHHKHHQHRPSYPPPQPIYYPPPQPTYYPPPQPSYKPSHKPSHKPSYQPSYESSYHPSYNYAAPQYDEYDEEDEEDEEYDDDDVTVPVVIEDDDYDDNEYRSSLYELSTELVDVPLDYFGQPVQSDERPSEISMDEDSDEDDEIAESEEDQDDDNEEEYKRSKESSKEGIKGNELKQINNRLKQKKT